MYSKLFEPVRRHLRKSLAVAALSAGALLTTTTATAGDRGFDRVAGTLFGAVVGAAVGDHIGGHEGAAVGGIIGATVGLAATSQHRHHPVDYHGGAAGQCRAV